MGFCNANLCVGILMQYLHFFFTRDACLRIINTFIIHENVISTIGN